MRAVPVLLLIASLLLCPYRCLGGMGSGHAPEEQTAGCSCCHHHKAPSEQTSGTGSSENGQEPSPPDEGCLCGNCLCHGAVRGDDGSTQEVVKAIHWMADIPPAAVLPDVIRAVGEWEEGPPNSTAVAGRSLRLVLQSLQI